MTRRTTCACLTLLAAVALVARLGLAQHAKAWRSPAVGDTKNIAMSLAGGKGFTNGEFAFYGPTSSQSPPYPLMLAGLFKAFGAVSVNAKGEVSLDAQRAERAYIVAIRVNALAGAGLVLLTFGAARAVGASPLAALAAGGLVAVWPTQVYAAQLVQPVTLVTCAVMATVMLYYRAVRSGPSGTWTAYAFVAALSALAEPVLLPAVLLSGGLVLLARQLTVAQRLRNVAILAFALVALVGPWVLRNAIVGRDRSTDGLAQHVTVVKGSFWASVWSGNNDFATGTDRLKFTARSKLRHESGASTDKEDAGRQLDMLDLSNRTKLNNRPEWFREQAFRDWAMEWIRAHPGRYMQLCGIRLAKTLTVDWDNPRSLQWSYLGMRLALVLMTVSGLVVARRERWTAALPIALAGGALVAYMLTMTTVRYALPFEPMQLVLGAAAATTLLPRPPTERPRVEQQIAPAAMAP